MCSAGAPAKPEDQTLTFAAEWDGDLELYGIQADGSGLTQLTSNTLDDFDPAWSPDGRQLAYVERNGREERLMLADADGQNARVLALESLGPIVYPTWSPDGNKLAFRNLEDLYVVDAESGETLNLTQNTQLFPLEISFSMDGSMLAFNAGSDAGPSVRNKLFAINVDGSGLIEFTIDDVDSVRRPSWHPTENLILFEGSGPTLGFQVFFAKLDGTIERLERQSTEGAMFPAWAPDGSVISYETSTFDALRIVAEDGTAETTVLELLEDGTAELSIWRFYWAPDSRHIVYATSVQGSATDSVDLFILDVCKGSSVTIADDVYPYSLVSWRPTP